MGRFRMIRMVAMLGVVGMGCAACGTPTQDPLAADYTLEMWMSERDPSARMRIAEALLAHAGDPGIRRDLTERATRHIIERSASERIVELWYGDLQAARREFITAFIQGNNRAFVAATCMELFQDPEEFVRVAEELGGTVRRRIPVLVDSLGEVRQNFMYDRLLESVLVGIGHEAIPALAAELESDSRLARLRSVDVLSRMAQRSTPGAESALRRGLEASRADVRDACQAALGFLDRHRKKAARDVRENVH